MPDGLHQGQPVLWGGTPIRRAPGAALLVHGRGATARGMLELAPALGLDGLAWAAPQAARGTWYPQRFLAPIEVNEPFLSSALAALDAVLERLADHGLARERVLLLGFSQGACLALEYAARQPTRFGAVVGLSGALIGPAGTPRPGPPRLAGTPVFLGCSDDDPHVPLPYVVETDQVLTALGAAVTRRIYPGLGHDINDDEARAVGELAQRLASR